VLLTARVALRPRSQRVVSFLVYLSEWEEGGETVFPLEGAGGLERLRGIDYRSCAQGLKVKPMRVGDALLFYSMHPNATFDKARHAPQVACRALRRTCGELTRRATCSTRCTAAAPW
jgi:prolyl 4-hydroxylase